MIHVNLIFLQSFCPVHPNLQSTAFYTLAPFFKEPSAIASILTMYKWKLRYVILIKLTQNVDFASSIIGGYLRIKGLTREWPEITTYFDGEVLGQEYHFLTGKWGASEAEDLKHWVYISVSYTHL